MLQLSAKANLLPWTGPVLEFDSSLGKPDLAAARGMCAGQLYLKYIIVWAYCMFHVYVVYILQFTIKVTKTFLICSCLSLLFTARKGPSNYPQYVLLECTQL